jgi:hypothetical protein
MTLTHSHPHTHHHLPFPQKPRTGFDLLLPLRRWVDNIKVNNRQFAHLIARVIPCCCPFERDVNFFGRTLFHIPPLCKLNPLYDEVVSLRFRALSYLADECGEDISVYIC